MVEHENPVEICISLGEHDIEEDFMSYNCNSVKINGKEFEISKKSTRDQLIIIPKIECSREKTRNIEFIKTNDMSHHYVKIIRHEILSSDTHLISWINNGITKFHIIEDVKKFEYYD